MVNKCLKECIKLRMTSIAFPAIGTGNLCYPNDVVARIMVEAVSSFLSSHKSSTLNMVYLVIFMTDTHLAFQQELAKQRSTIPETSYMPLASSPQENDTPRRSNDPESLSNPGFRQHTKEFFGSFLPENEGNLAISHPTSLSYEQMMYRDIELVIYGETHGAVQRAVQKLQRIIDEQFITDSVDDPNVDKLSQSEIDKLQHTSKQMHVELDINLAPLNFIRLKGDKTDVHKMRSCVIETLAELEKRIYRQREAENMQKLVQWKRMDSQETEYDVAENYEIELAYKAQKAEYRHRTTVEHYTVDFTTMEEIDHNSNDRFQVVRVKKYQEGKYLVM